MNVSTATTAAGTVEKTVVTNVTSARCGILLEAFIAVSRDAVVISIFLLKVIVDFRPTKIARHWQVAIASRKLE